MTRGGFKQFFEDQSGALSMTRLLCFISWFPATLVLIVNRHSAGIADILAWYLGAFVLGYVGGKVGDAIGSFGNAPQPGTQIMETQERTTKSAVSTQIME